MRVNHEGGFFCKGIRFGEHQLHYVDSPTYCWSKYNNVTNELQILVLNVTNEVLKIKGHVRLRPQKQDMSDSAHY